MNNFMSKTEKKNIFIVSIDIGDHDKLEIYYKYNLIDIKTGKILYKPGKPANTWFDEMIPDCGNKNFNCVMIKTRHYSSDNHYIDYFNYIDYNGKILYKLNEPKKWFADAYEFYDNFNAAKVQNPNCTYNLIDTKGNLLYEPNKPQKWPLKLYDPDKYGWILAIMYNGKCNFINIKGEVLYEPNNPNKWFDDAEIYPENFEGKYFNVTINKTVNKTVKNIKYRLNRKGKLYENTIDYE